MSTDNTLPVQSDSKWALSLLLFHLSSLTLTEQSSGIFSSELLRVDSLSRSSFISLKRSATHCAVSRASGSWSQHSLMVAQTKATPYRRLHLCYCISVQTQSQNCFIFPNISEDLKVLFYYFFWMFNVHVRPLQHKQATSPKY